MFNLNHYIMKRSTVFIILLHLFYWTAPLIRLYNSYNSGGGPDFESSYFNYCVDLAMGAVSFYTVYFFIFPYFIQQSKPITGVTNLILCFLIISAAIGLPVLATYLNTYPHSFYHVNIRNLYLFIASFGIAAIMIKGFVTWALEIKYKQQLEKSNLESNLALLKARINPHFLFNTLNNIDVLIEKDATVASTYLKKLSDILRFTLYESPLATISLNKEADYIKQYIELQQIRTSNTDFAGFNFEADNNNLQIAPMLFIPFIENAFKYCTNKKIKNAVVIKLIVHKNKITFNCSNAYDEGSKVQYEDSSGLGLELIRSRLELLYPQNYQLDIHKTTDRFNINLTITLHDNKLPDH